MFAFLLGADIVAEAASPWLKEGLLGSALVILVVTVVILVRAYDKAMQTRISELKAAQALLEVGITTRDKAIADLNDKRLELALASHREQLKANSENNELMVKAMDTSQLAIGALQGMNSGMAPKPKG